MRTVVAVTAPLLAAGPNALTQSPTARSPDEADLVALTVVELDVVIFKVCVLGWAGFLFFVVDLELPEDGRGKFPGERVMPETVTVDPFTAVTLPVATASEANCLRKLLAPDPPVGKPGRVPFRAPSPRPFPLRNWKPPAAPLAEPAVIRVAGPLHKPLAPGAATVILCAAMAVLDVFVAFPVTDTQSPAARALTASVVVLENWVVVVQVTVVWPVLGFCTSMLEALSAATLPDAPRGRIGVVVAAPAAVAVAVIVRRTVIPPPRKRGQRRRVVRLLVGVCISVVPLSGSVRCCTGV
jgi:hypothetical protein